MPEYPSISSLTDLINKHQIVVSVIQPCKFASDWFEVVMSIGPSKFTLFIDDEYSDLKYHSPELTLCVVLKSLEELTSSSDFLNWCNLTGVNMSNIGALDYYESALIAISQIESLIGQLDSQISDLDFSLNAGPAQYLRLNS